MNFRKRVGVKSVENVDNTYILDLQDPTQLPGFFVCFFLFKLKEIFEIFLRE